MREQCGPLLSPAHPVLHPPHHRHPASLADVHREGDPGARLPVPIVSSVKCCYCIDTTLMQSEVSAQVSTTNEDDWRLDWLTDWWLIWLRKLTAVFSSWYFLTTKTIQMNFCNLRVQRTQQDHRTRGPWQLSRNNKRIKQSIFVCLTPATRLCGCWSKSDTETFLPEIENTVFMCLNVHCLVYRLDRW